MDEAKHQKYYLLVQKLAPTLRDLATQLNEVTGAIAHTEKQHAYDVLTEWDVRVEQALRARLAVLDPETPIVGEEEGGDRTAKRYWLIDPIDGTIHFTRGTPFCSSMLALIEDGRPVCSIIYLIGTGDLYYAIQGHGAYKNDQPIATSKRSGKESMVLTEMRLNSDVNVAIHRELANSYKLLNLTCAGYEFAMVADGRAEARIGLDPFGNDYDFAAGSLLVQEAGGVVKDFVGATYTTAHRDMIVAASEPIYQELLGVIKRHRNE